MKVVAYLGCLSRSMLWARSTRAASISVSSAPSWISRAALPAADSAPHGRARAGEQGFAKGQVGSSAMPHKMSNRSCERVNSLTPC